MSASTKLSSSVKALCFLAETYPIPKSSKEIAEHTGVNASKLRQLLSMIAKSKIVNSEQGTKGGFLLSKDPKTIHLQEIYCSIEDRKAFHLDVTKNNGKKGKKNPDYTKYFLGLFSEIQVDIENKMKNISLSDIMKNLNMKINYK
ncbi:MAG: Rrf2 family transcriptional regulator [Bacteroidota bacterium]